MNLAKNLKTFWYIFFAPMLGKNHQERLEYFYSRQADNYDATRPFLLAGRTELFQSIPLAGGEKWVDCGGGTAGNFEAIKERVPLCSEIHIIDLSQSMLEQARIKKEKYGWKNVFLHKGSVDESWPDWGPVDRVTFSYSLSMTENWFDALTEAKRNLKPGGLIGVVDFYAAKLHEDRPGFRQAWWRRTLFPLCTEKDSVSIKPDYHVFLNKHFEVEKFEIGRFRYPLSPMYIEYFTFLGRKR